MDGRTLNEKSTSHIKQLNLLRPTPKLENKNNLMGYSLSYIHNKIEQYTGKGEQMETVILIHSILQKLIIEFLQINLSRGQPVKSNITETAQQNNAARQTKVPPFTKAGVVE